jgi:hypothetical protein
MKSRRHDNMNRLWKAFAVSYREKEKSEARGPWREEVIERIRRLDLHFRGNGYLELLEGVVWRYAPVACILILILAAVLFRFDILSDDALVRLFAGDPLRYSLMDYIG